MGQLGTTPSHPIPDSHNAGDFGSFLIGAPHEYAITAEQLAQHRTDGHLDRLEQRGLLPFVRDQYDVG